MPKLLTALAGWGLADEDDDEPNGPKVNWAIYLSGLEIETRKKKQKWASNRFTHKHKSVRSPKLDTNSFLPPLAKAGSAADGSPNQPSFAPPPPSPEP
jgi:hypothetical protein